MIVFPNHLEPFPRQTCILSLTVSTAEKESQGEGSVARTSFPAREGWETRSLLTEAWLRLCPSPYLWMHVLLEKSWSRRPFSEKYSHTYVAFKKKKVRWMNWHTIITTLKVLDSLCFPHNEGIKVAPICEIAADRLNADFFLR